MNTLGFPCLKERCYSPIACNAFGYCREQHFEARCHCQGEGKMPAEVEELDRDDYADRAEWKARR